METKSFGDVLRELRDKANLSLRELARKVGASAPFLSDVELGRRYPSDELLAKLAESLRVSVEELKKYDHRESLSDLKRLIEKNPSLGFAFRTAVDEIKEGKLSPDDLAKKLKRKS